jgi:hypothetical protein
VPISREEFTDAYPTLFHVSLAQDIGKIMKYGLLSTSALLDRCEVKGEQRLEIESCPRPRSVRISHSVYGEFLINDQAPMNAAALSKCLTDLSPAEWCSSLNGARAAAGRPKIVFSFETGSVFDVLDFDSFEFSAINSGNTMRRAALRGSSTFLKARDYPFQERRKHRGLGDAIAEVTYPYAVTSSQLAAICMTSKIVLHPRTTQLVERKF